MFQGRLVPSLGALLAIKPRKGKAMKQEPIDKASSKAFMDQDGADPSAVMKGDRSQHVDQSTAPGTPVRRPPIVRGGNFSLKREPRTRR